MRELEDEKIKLEIRELQKPFWRKLEFYKFLIPTVIVALSVFYTCNTGVLDAKKTLNENEKTLLKIQSSNLKSEVSEFQKEIRQFEIRKRNIQDTIRLLQDSIFLVKNKYSSAVDSIYYYKNKHNVLEKRMQMYQNVLSQNLTEKDQIYFGSEIKDISSIDFIQFLENKEDLCLLNNPRNKLNLRVSNYSNCRGCKDWRDWVYANIGDTVSFSITINNFSDYSCYNTKISFRFELNKNNIVSSSIVNASNSINIVTGGCITFIENPNNLKFDFSFLPNQTIFFQRQGNIKVDKTAQFVKTDAMQKSSWLEFEEIPANFESILVFQFHVKPIYH